MSIQSVREYFKQFGRENDVMEKEGSSATVELAAELLGVIPGRIAKSMLFILPDESTVMIIAAGDVKIDNRKYKDIFKTKPKICPADLMVELTGHELGGNCPFGLKTKIDVYLDESLKRFDTVFPAAGSHNSMIELNLDDLYKFSNAISFIDVCKPKE